MKLIRLLFIFSLFAFNFTFSYGQNWLWGEEGTESSSIGCFAAADKMGNVYKAGEYETTIKFGAWILNTTNFEDYLVKYDSDGRVLWATEPLCAGSRTYAYGGSVATDKFDNVFLAGSFKGTLQFSSFSLSGNVENMFVAKYDSLGNVKWAKESKAFNRGNSIGTYGPDIRTDKSGNLLIVGSFNNNIVFGTDTLTGDSINMFVTKYDTGGNILWSKQSQCLLPNVYGDQYVYPGSISLDKLNNIYLTGATCATTKFGDDTLIVSNPVGDYFIIKYDSNGNTIWVHTFPYGWPYNSINDNTCNLYITGHDSYIGNTGNAILVKYDSNGNFHWIQKTNGGIGSWYGDDITIDTLNEIYIVITSIDALGDSVAFGGKKLYYNKPGDVTAAFLIKLDTSGKASCSSIIDNGWENDPPNAISCNPSGIYVYMGGVLANKVIINADTLILFRFLEELK